MKIKCFTFKNNIVYRNIDTLNLKENILNKDYLMN